MSDETMWIPHPKYERTQYLNHVLEKNFELCGPLTSMNFII